MRSLSRLLFPRSIAFVGGRECAVAIRKTQALGFPGPIWPVNPRRSELAGLSTFASVADLPEAPDAAFVAVPREPAIAVLGELSRIGAGGAVVFASGFAETGDGHLQRSLIEAAAGLPFLGPNCNGYVNLLARAVLWPDEHGASLCDRGVAVVAQSGNIAVNLTMLRRALPVAGVFALGNQADVDIAQMVDALAADDRVTAIGLHIEGLTDVGAFAQAAERARHRKPIVALKTGRSEAGARITFSHTASLSGEDALYDALFRRLGIARVSSVTAFAETLKLLHCGGPIAGPRLVSMSCSGGEAALVADLAEGRSVAFPAFDATSAARVAGTLGGLVAVSNPLDYQTFIWGDRDKLVATFSAALSGGFDAGMLVLDVPALPDVDSSSWITTAEAFGQAAVATGIRAAVVATLPECMPEDLGARLSGDGIAPLIGLDDALTAFECAREIGRAWAEPGDTLRLLAAPRRVAEAQSLSESDAKRLLAAAGITVPAGRVCEAAEAPTVAGALGFPVVVKISDAALAHKTEAGGVALDLGDAPAVAAAAARMGGQVLVERMVQGATCELVVGVKADPQFGLALVIGAGGVLAELLADTATLLLPTTRAAIDAALSGLRLSALIDGFRGRSGDRAATLDAILAIARFAQSRADLLELEVNPLLVLPPGQGTVAVDALIRLSTAL